MEWKEVRSQLMGGISPWLYQLYPLVASPAPPSVSGGVAYRYQKNSLSVRFIEGSLEVKLPTIWRDEKQSRAEAERRGR